MMNIHSFFALLVLLLFVARITLQKLFPHALQSKLLKIAPHVLGGILVASGIVLVLQGDWLNRESHWIMSKLLLLVLFVVWGSIAMRSHGIQRWLAFIAAVGCYLYIFVIASNKQSFI